MTHLACTMCGRAVSAVAPLAQLAADERLCPRCGALLREDRRSMERRVYVRRQSADRVRNERRDADRRTAQRRTPADRYRFNPLVDGRIRWQTVQRPLDQDR